MEGPATPLDCGTGIINVLLSKRLDWKQILSEWIDNSLGAGATAIVIRKVKSTQKLEVEDNGRGCDDLKRMESLARSVRQGGDRAGMFGIGGVISQIQASQGGLVEVVSTTAAKRSEIEVHWGECVDRDRLEARHFDEYPAPKGSRTGTTIVVHNCRRFRDVTKLARELGYYYSGVLRQGTSIRLEIDGEKVRIRPYEHPPFVLEVPYDFDLDGHRITGLCGLVDPAHANPYYGWSVHWGYRFVGQFHEPAGGRPTNRIYAEVYLPETWRNISVTKDSFRDEADGLWAALTERCREVIEAADAQSQEIELHTASREAEDLIGLALAGTKRAVKGRRPGSAGKSGTVEPTGNGSPHRHFSSVQPGDKAEIDDLIPARTPDRVRIVWDQTIEGPYTIAPSGARCRTFVLTLNSSVPHIAAFKDDPQKLAVLCITYLAQEITEGSDKVQRMFPFFRQLEFKAVYTQLLKCISKSLPSMA